VSGLAPDAIGRFLSEHGLAVEPLDKREKFRLQQRWRETFCLEVKEATGQWVYEGIDWHAFSYGYAPCLKGGDAETAFNSHSGRQCYCWSSDLALIGYFCQGHTFLKGEVFKVLLTEHPAIADLFVVDESFDWTLVLVHEGEVGPFFKQRSPAQLH